MATADLEIDRIVALLQKYKQRATYGALGKIVGRHPRSVMQGRPKCARDSWIVSAATGIPTDYGSSQIDPDLESSPSVLETAEELAAWLREHS